MQMTTPPVGHLEASPDRGNHTGERPGMALRGPGFRGVGSTTQPKILLAGEQAVYQERF